MKKLLPLLALIALLLSTKPSFGNKYRVNDLRIENLFTQSADMTQDILNGSLNQLMNRAVTPPYAEVSSEKNATTAIILALFLGGFGVHRMYLGTSAGVVVGYIGITGCSFVVGLFCFPVWIIGCTIPLIDVIFLAMNYDDISKYENNKKFFMWAGQ